MSNKNPAAAGCPISLRRRDFFIIAFPRAGKKKPIGLLPVRDGDCEIVDGIEPVFRGTVGQLGGNHVHLFHRECFFIQREAVPGGVRKGNLNLGFRCVNPENRRTFLRIEAKHLLFGICLTRQEPIVDIGRLYGTVGEPDLRPGIVQRRLPDHFFGRLAAGQQHRQAEQRRKQMPFHGYALLYS